jgi:hypothetical protein
MMLWRSQIWAIGESILSSYQHHRRTVKVTKTHRLRPTASAPPHPLRRNRCFDNVFRVANTGAQYQWGHPTLFADLPKLLLSIFTLRLMSEPLERSYQACIGRQGRCQKPIKTIREKFFNSPLRLRQAMTMTAC